MDPDRIRYFEAHGTGTAAGDPIEASAIGEAVGRRRQGAALPIGSAKTNIGHTEAASGLVGVVKGLLMLRHGQVPPSLHFETPNPHIDFPALGLRVATKLEKLWAADPVLGINSFGFGGTNAGILLAAPPRPARAEIHPRPRRQAAAAAALRPVGRRAGRARRPLRRCPGRRAGAAKPPALPADPRPGAAS